MKRSEINRIIAVAIETFDKYNVRLPCWAYWSAVNWQTVGKEADEIRKHQLGWNITDFGSGNFEKVGLLIFVVRNGHLVNAHPTTSKTYAEKYFLVGPEQVTPWHFHWQKTEDLINRCGGRLEVELAWAADDERSLSNRQVSVQIDGVTHKMPASGKILLEPGESVTFPPKLCHKFYGHANDSRVFAGEVSSLNDDYTDNCFLGLAAKRSPIEEDEPAKYLLLNEYPEIAAVSQQIS